MELTKEQAAGLYEIGRKIANFWLETCSELDPDYKFDADGDSDLVDDYCRENLCIDLHEECEEEIWDDVWAEVGDGYASVVKETQKD